MLNSGTASGAAVALLDFGPLRVVRDRIDLELPHRTFLGRATLFGSDARGGTFVRLGDDAGLRRGRRGRPARARPPPSSRRPTSATTAPR